MLQEQVFCARGVDIERTVDASTEETEVDTEVVLCCALPSEVLISQSSLIVGVIRFVSDEDTLIASAERHVERLNGAQCSVCPYRSITCGTHAETQFELVEPTDILEEVFLFHAPSDSHRREETPLVALGEHRSAVVTTRDGEQVAILERVVDASHVREQRILREPGTHASLIVGIGDIDIAEIVPKEGRHVDALSAHATTLGIVLGSTVEESDAHGVVAKDAVVEQHVVERPGKVTVVIATSEVVAPLTSCGTCIEEDARARVTEIRSKLHLVHESL